MLSAVFVIHATEFYNKGLLKGQKMHKPAGRMRTMCAARSDRVHDTVALRVSQGRVAPKLKMTAGVEVK